MTVYFVQFISPIFNHLKSLLILFMSRKNPNVTLPFFGVHVAEWKRIYSDCLDYLEYEDDTEERQCNVRILPAHKQN